MCTNAEKKENKIEIESATTRQHHSSIYGRRTMRNTGIGGIILIVSDFETAVVPGAPLGRDHWVLYGRVHYTHGTF